MGPKASNYKGSKMTQRPFLRTLTVKIAIWNTVKIQSYEFMRYFLKNKTQNVKYKLLANLYCTLSTDHETSFLGKPL